MKEGKLVPIVSYLFFFLNTISETISFLLQEEVLELLKESMLENVDKSKGFLIDGYPREVAQARKFEELVY